VSGARIGAALHEVGGVGGGASVIGSRAMRIPSIVALGVFLAAGAARADMLGPGEKGVKLSIHVDAAVPAGKLLIVANTFRGADIVKPGEDQEVEWHPLRGAMQLKLIAADQGPKLTELRERLDSEEAQKLVAAGVACAPPFDGIRTISDTLVATEIRWSFAVSFAGAGCTAKLLRTEYLDETRAVVDPKATLPTAADMPDILAPPAPPFPTPTTTTPAPVPVPVTAPASTPATPASPPASSGACSVAGEGGGASGGLVALVLLGVRRRVSCRTRRSASR
jgi:hypothetical protein